MISVGESAASLYASRRPLRLWIGSKLKAMAPIPREPAFAKVSGFPHATQIGGCPLPYGFGRMLWGPGTDQPFPSNE